MFYTDWMWKNKDDGKTGSNRPLSESSAALRYYRGTEHARHEKWPMAAVFNIRSELVVIGALFTTDPHHLLPTRTFFMIIFFSLQLLRLLQDLI